MHQHDVDGGYIGSSRSDQVLPEIALQANNVLHTERRAASVLKSMSFAAAR
jgi:hypothetical protein